MQRSSVYWRYKDKDTLVKAAVAEPFLALLKPLRSLTEPTDSWPELSRALETMMNRIQAEPDTVKAGLLLKMQRWEPPTLGGSAVLEGSRAAEADLASFFGRIMPEGHDGHQVGPDLAWIAARFIDGFMLAPALGYPLRAESTTRILIPLLTSGSTPEPLPTTV
jgi:AcrR family transcriptional regulator